VDDPGIAVAELDGEGGVGDQHGDGLPGVDTAEGGFLPGGRYWDRTSDLLGVK
jgi:hypothetical protein